MPHHVHKLTAFRVRVEHRPGTLQKVTQDLCTGGANLRALWAWAEEEGQGVVMFVPEDPGTVTGCSCATCCAAQAVPVLWVEGEDVRGGLDEQLKPIAAQHLNIQAVQVMALEGKFAAVFTFADEAALDAAACALGGCCCS